jgi:CHAP domain-containing protein
MNTKYVALVLLAAGGAAASSAPAYAYYAPGASTKPPPAVITGDDYPAAWKSQNRDAFATPFGLNRECVSFVAWKIYRDTGGKKVPTTRSAPADWATYSINVDGEWGNAGNWAAYATAHRIQVDHRPTVGSVAQWNAHTAGMTVGHVGMVKAVNSDGSIDIEQYNLRENGKYSVLHMAKNSKVIDTSNGNRPWTVPWPDNFIHVHGH